MTTPPSLPTEPLLTLERLGQWAQENPLLDPTLAGLVIDAVTVLLRHHGDSYWTIETLPTRARDIGYIVAKDYYLNPRQLRQETTGPLQESLHENVLRGLELTDDQKAELAALAVGVEEDPVSGLWSMSFSRGPVETHKESAGGVVVLFDTRGGWPIEYLNREDNIVFEPEV